MSLSTNNQDPSNRRETLGKRFSGKRKTRLAVIAVVLAVVMIPLGVAAAFSIQTSISNQFKADYFEVELNETFTPPDNWETADPVAKAVRYLNKGTLPAMLRVQMAESWIGTSGEALSNEIMDGSDKKSVVQKNWNTSGSLEDSALWTYHDGWYYYNKLLQPAGTPGDTVQILDSIQLYSKTELLKNYSEADYNLSFLHEYVKTDDVKTLWNLEPVVTGGNVSWTF